MFVPYNTVLGRLAMTPLVSFHPGEQDCLIPTGELFVDGTKWDLGSFHPGERDCLIPMVDLSRLRKLVHTVRFIVSIPASGIV